MSLLGKLGRWIPAFGWMGVIFYLSSQTGPGGPPWQAIAAHIVEYGVLAGLYLFALRGNENLSAGRSAALAAALAVLYGISDEVHQSFVPGRHPDPLDLLIDLGAATAVALIGARLWPATGPASPNRERNA